MKPKTFNIVVVVTVVSVAWALLLGSQTRDLVIEFVRGQALVTEVDTSRLTKIEITKGEDSVVLEKRGEGFLVVSRESYPADTGRINNLIQQVTNIRCARQITDSPETHAELEVAGKAVESTTVKFFGTEADKPMLGVVVGKSDGAGRYVRLLASDEVFLSEKSVLLDTDALAYVDKEISSLEKIQSVSLSGNGPAFEIRQDGSDSGPKLMSVPEARVANMAKVGSTFSAAKSLSFADFFGEADIKDVKFDHTYRVKTEAGEDYTYLLGKKGEDYYCKVSAKYTGPQSFTPAQIKAAKEDKKALEKQEAFIAAMKKVRSFVDRHQSWVYKLPPSSGESMTESLETVTTEDKKFLAVEAKQLRSVAVTKGKDSYSITQEANGMVKLAPLPAGKNEQPEPVDITLNSVVKLEWDKRLKPDAKELASLKFDGTHTVTLDDKTVYTFEIAQKDAKFYLKASAKADGASKEAAAEVAKFMKRHAGHVYEMPAGPVGNMVKPVAELVKDEKAQPAKVRASHILISYKGSERSTSERTKEEAKKLADEAVAAVKAAGADFGKIAEKMSDGPSKTKGGDLSFFAFPSMAKPFSEAAFKLKAGEISGIVETKFGFHVIKRTR